MDTKTEQSASTDAADALHVAESFSTSAAELSAAAQTHVDLSGVGGRPGPDLCAQLAIAEALLAIDARLAVAADKLEALIYVLENDPNG